MDCLVRSTRVVALVGIGLLDLNTRRAESCSPMVEIGLSADAADDATLIGCIF